MERPLGPVEYLVVVFEGHQLDAGILPALHELIDNGLIRVIDSALVSKDDAGQVTLTEASELTGAVAEDLAQLDGEWTGLLSEADLLMVGEDLAPNTTAAALLFENVWATRFAEAVRSANGQVVTNVRIPNDVVEAVRQSLMEAGN